MLEKRTVNFRHLQATACVAMTLVSILPQGLLAQQATVKVSRQAQTQVSPTAPAAPQSVQNDTTEIGRASCRERV